MNSYERTRQRENNGQRNNIAELGTVTSPGNKINAMGAGEYREIPLVAPFGIRWNPPAGKNVELIKNWNNGKSIVAVGTVVDQELPPGEIELYSMGGAKIRLNNDGTVVINDAVTITLDGTVTAKHFISSQYGGVYYG